MNKFIKEQIKKLKPSATLAINEESNRLKKSGKKIYKSSTSFGFGLPVKVNENLELMFDYAIDLGYVEE